MTRDDVFERLPAVVAGTSGRPDEDQCEIPCLPLSRAGMLRLHRFVIGI